MGVVFSICKYCKKNHENKREHDIPPSEYTPPKKFEKNGKYYVLMKKQPFTEI